MANLTNLISVYAYVLIALMIVVLLVVALAKIVEVQGQVVFRPHFLYKHRQQEKLEKENKRRQETLEQEQQQFETRPQYNDPSYYYYYQNQGNQQYSGSQFTGNNYYRPQSFGYLQPRANQVKRSIDSPQYLSRFYRNIKRSMGQ